MNSKLQSEIRAFIGDDPAQAVDRVRTKSAHGFDFVYQLLWQGESIGYPGDSTFIEVYGLATYGAGLSALLGNLHDKVYASAACLKIDFISNVADYWGGGNDHGVLAECLAIVATADAETRIAAMLWAAAWIIQVEVNENE